MLALSGGMAQRLMVARAIMHRPTILFLDEPTAGLDPQSRIALWEILGELHGDGQTILLTTHYMEEADQLCDRLAIVDHGRLLAMDTPERLKRSVGADAMVTVQADGDLERLAAILREQIAGVSRVEVVDGSIRLWCARTAGMLPRVIEVAEAAGHVRARRLRFRTHPRDRLHRPHRQGAPRMSVTSRCRPCARATTAVAAIRIARATRRARPRARPRRPRRGSRSARCCCATSWCCART